MVKALVIIFLLGDIELQSKILKGRYEPISNRELIEAARQGLKQVKYRSMGRVNNNLQVQYINYDSAITNMRIKYKP